MPNFVERTRPDESTLQFLPLNRRPAEPQRAPLAENQIISQEAQLDQMRHRHDRLAHRKHDTTIYKSTAGPKVIRQKVKPQPCLLTCAVK